MATPAALYFAGIGTVVGALTLGFSGALMLTSVQPIHKEPPGAFAKRDQPVNVQTAPAQAKTTGRGPPPAASAEFVPAMPTKAEEVVALQFAPPRSQTYYAPAPRMIAADPAATRVTATPEVKTPVEHAVKPASGKLASSDAAKRGHKTKKEYRKPTTIAEKNEPLHKQHVERRKGKIEVADDDEQLHPLHLLLSAEPVVAKGSSASCSEISLVTLGRGRARVHN